MKTGSEFSQCDKFREIPFTLAETIAETDGVIVRTILFASRWGADARLVAAFAADHKSVIDKKPYVT